MQANVPLAVSIPKAAEMLGLGKSSIYRLLNTNRLPLVKVGRRSLVPVRAIEAFLASPAKEGA